MIAVPVDFADQSSNFAGLSDTFQRPQLSNLKNGGAHVDVVLALLVLARVDHPVPDVHAAVLVPLLERVDLAAHLELGEGFAGVWFFLFEKTSNFVLIFEVCID